MEWVHVAERLLFWFAISLLAYVYVGYPCVAWLRAKLRPRPHVARPIEPTVAVVVVAHNEEARVAGRLENLLALDYPREKLEIVFASDGSIDDTVERARAYQAAGVRVRAFRRRRGKSAVLNDVMPSINAEIVVFADARQQFEANALRALVADFADPEVGAVSGALMMMPTGDAAVERGCCFYWRYEKFIRRQESRAGSTLGATGAIYAIRRELFTPIPDDTLLDDVVIPARIVRQGCRVVFEPEARAYDCASANAAQEFARKVRTIAGTFQLFTRERWLFNMFRNPIWFQTMSHKGLRLLVPALHALAFVANVALVEADAYRWLLGAQLFFYGAAAAGGVHRGERRRPALLNVPYMMCLLLWATTVGFGRFAMGRQRATWERLGHVAHG
jgi:poly-beta-1,6-N-acetyl-D-glucosamine synthase